MRRVGAVGQVVDEEGYRFGRMSGCLQRDEANTAELDGVAVMERLEGVLRACGGAQVDGRARAIAEFEMACDEIGVQVRQERVGNAQPCSDANVT